ncbi:MAG: endo-1,4-beta-xylanase [Ruminococcus sp.]|nr:endo-1,4-beta-xylanase [Ruminococcus sp.]
MGLTMLPQVSTTSFNSSAASPGDRLSVGNGTNQHKGVSDGYSYEIWIDTTGGSGTMTLGQGGTFKAEWSASVPSGNFLARRGKDYGSTTKATECGDIVLNYEADYRQTGSASGNSRLCVYGWFENQGAAGNVPLVEYYIIEDWVDWCPDGNGKMVTIDGAQYKIFQMDHTGPTIHGRTETFKQYFSVRQSKRKSGTISVSEHFKAWAQQGWGIGNLYEVALNAEGWQSSGVADVTKLTFGGTPPTTEPTEPEPKVNYTKPSSGSGVTDDFEGSGTSWTGRGEDVSYGLTSDFAHGGKQSLYVENRSASWNGFSNADAELEAGGSYNISLFAGFKSNNYDSMGYTLGVQYDAGGTTEYVNLVDATGSSGKWAELETDFDIPSNASNISLYVQSSYTETASDSDLIPFFIDDVTLTKSGSTPTPTQPSTQTPTQGQTPSYTSDSLVGKFGHIFKMGTSVSPHELNSGANFIKKHFNSITPENELKPDSLLKQGSSDNTRCNVSLANAAQTLKFCEQNGIGVRGHTFVWYSQTPDWFFKENFQSSGAYVSKDIMNKRLENFIKDTFDLLAKEYPNLNVYAYDVCNELFVNDGGGLRPGSNSGWTRVYGDNNDEFIINAFTYARKYAPAGCKLYINDYNEYIPAKTNDIYNIAMKLKELGVIDGIGMQSHLDVSYPSAQVYKTGLEKFLSTGLEVSITELDITESSYNSQAQADLYKAVFEMAVAHDDQINSFTVWGTHDDISWRKQNTPLMFGSNYQPKKAYDAVMSITVPSPTPTTTSKTTQKPNTTTPTTPAEPTGLAGDVNCDGKVTIADAAALLQNLANGDKYKLTDEGKVNGDVDGNAGLTASDALQIQKYDAGLVTKLTLTGGSSTTQKKTDVVTTPAAQTYFDSNFNSSASGWTGRGDASVEISSDSYYSGKSLFVSGRSDYWHGAATELGSDFKAGNTYSFSGAVMQQSGSATTMQLTLQYTLNGEENYDQIASATVKSGEWTKLENTAYTIPSGATNMLIYVEAPDSYTDFYIDEFVGATEGTKSSVTTGGGMVGKAPVTTQPTTKPGNFPDPSKPMMAISFDDGTDPNGKKIIDALAKEGFTATFFYVGNWIKDESQVKYAYQKGMEVANHTTTHPYLTNLSAGEIKNEYNQTYTKLKNIIGAEPSKLLRLPYLASNGTVTSALSDVPMITCSIDTEDWNGASKDQIVSKIKNAMNNGSANGSIILCHETYASTAAAIEEIAPYAKAQGWQIVSISEMFAAKGKTLNGGQIYQKCN